MAVEVAFDVQLADLQKVPSSNCNSLSDSGIETVNEGYEEELTSHSEGSCSL